jgi:hypothetical protein
MSEQTTTVIPAPAGSSASASVPNTNTGRPEFLQPKFSSVEEQARAYVELEKQFSSRGAPAASATPAPATAPQSLDIPTQQPTQFDFAPFSAELQKNGKLSDQSYQTLANKGFPRDLVDGYIEGTSAREQRRVSTVYQAAGGQQQFDAIRNWAASTLNPAEITSLNNALNNPDVNIASLAAQGLAARYAAANGVTPDLTMGKTAAAGVEGYASRDEMVRDMMDPRYNTDEAFRETVVRKIDAARKRG